MPYARVNLWHSASGHDRMHFASAAANTSFAMRTGHTSLELAGGASWHVRPRVTLYGELGALRAMGGTARVRSGVQGSMGVRVAL